MTELQSYVAGQWTNGSGDAKTLHDPATEAVLGSVNQGGVDFDAALLHARNHGAPALASLGFRGRAEILKKLATKLHECRDELIEISGRNGGNTRGDAKFDLDGMTGTLSYYASLGAQMPTGNLLVDGESVQLGRTPRFWGQHILSPRRGVALHINAFNFPGWGMGEKMACALLAGVPVIEKPGTASALLAFRIAQIVVESGFLPAGSFQFMAGSVSGLLDRLGAMDGVAFTGSAATGAIIRGNKHLIQNSVRVTIEADSINSAVLGPDVDLGGDTFAQFVTNIATDMTQKAGQKCTAVRRIFVPVELMAEAEAAILERLKATKIGNPLDNDVRMGPIASHEALTSVRAGMQHLLGAAELICGGIGKIAERGYFVAPTLLRAKDAHAEVLHTLEVFGPCATVIPYSGKAPDAVSLVNRGGGGLVASIYSDDREFLDSTVLGIAPWHGRVWLGSEKTQGQALGPGAVLPHTIHGGPGRAGGGEELGGLRGLTFYLQRTAVQGDRTLVGRSFGSGDAN